MALLPVSDNCRFSELGYHVWCGSAVRDEDGLYHLFYSRWPLEAGFGGWVSRSEVAHATSHSATGPYTFSDLSLPARGPEFWDGGCTHNPTIHKFGERYYLYYMGTRGDLPATRPFSWSHRNNQRIGIAVADSPYGPWERSATPLIDATPGFHDALCCANPSVTRRPEGDFLMVYKGVTDRNPLPFGGPVTHIVATSASPTGPFEKYPDPVFENPNTAFPAEDPFIWRQDDRYWAIIKDMGGFFTGAGISLALMTSADGCRWEPAEQCLVSKLEYRHENGDVYLLEKLERSQLLLEDGEPTVLFCAAAEDLKNEVPTFNLAIPLRFGGQVQTL